MTTVLFRLVVGKDSLVLENTFQYNLSVSVSTVSGNGSPDFISGTLSESQMKPSFLAVDNDYNILSPSGTVQPGGACPGE